MHMTPMLDLLSPAALLCTYRVCGGEIVHASPRKMTEYVDEYIYPHIREKLMKIRC
jgi:hypothetical protein